MKIKGVMEDFKIKKLKSDNSKNISRNFSELLWTVQYQFIFRQFLDPAYTSSQDLQAPSYVVGANYRVLICCTCHFQSGSLCLFQFLMFLVSSASNFCPDTRGRWWSLFQAHLFSPALGREQHCKQISLACVGSAQSVSAALGLLLLTACVLSFYTSQALCCSAGNYPRWALGFIHFPGLSFSGADSRVLLKGSDLIGPAFDALPRSEQLR